MITRSKTKNHLSNESRPGREGTAAKQPKKQNLNECEDEGGEKIDEEQEQHNSSLHPFDDLEYMKKVEGLLDESTSQTQLKNRRKNKLTKSKDFVENLDTNCIKAQSNGDNKSKYRPYLLIFLIILIIGICLMKPTPLGNLNWFSNQSKVDKVNQFVGKLDSHISQIGMKTLNSALTKAFNEPVFLLLIGNTKQKRSLNEFASEIGEFVMSLVKLEAVPVFSLESNHQMKDIEQVYHVTFIEKKQPVLILENLEQISPQIAMVFHQFANGKESKIAFAFSVATLTHPYNFEVNSNITLRDTSSFSSRCLSDLWKTSLSKDDLECLVNRLTEHPVLLLTN